MSSANSLQRDLTNIDTPATLLFVDDERRVLNSMRAIFRRDHKVLLANSGAEALELLAANHVDVIVSDQRMPGMTGVEMLQAARQQHPDAMRILLTGHADLEAIEASINQAEVFRYLMKPCPPADLKQAVALAVEAIRSTQTSAQVIPFPNAPETDAEDPPLLTDRVDSAQADDISTRISHSADVLVLTRDDELFAEVASCHPDGELYHARNISDAVELLGTHPIGVLLTDSAADEVAVDSLTSELKRSVPELVTIIISDRSDAHRLISLINNGQVFRFLLKPLPHGQCRLWIESAVRRFNELAADSDQIERYRVESTVTPETLDGGLFSTIVQRISRLRLRLSNAGANK